MAEMASNDVIKSLRHPEIITTDRYLNDAIKTKADIRFHPETILRQVSEMPLIARDGALFAVVDLNSSGSTLYPCHMYTNLYDRELYTKNIDSEFREFV